MSRAWVRALCVVLGLAIAGPSAAARVEAQDKPAQRGKRAHGKRAKPVRVESGEGSDDAKAERRAARHAGRKRHARDKREATGQPASPEASPPSAKPEAGPSAAALAAQAAASGVNAQIVKEGDTSVKMMEFTGLGIEGRLRSPQLVYFVQRVHAEFERPRLPHRSFMPELEASTGRTAVATPASEVEPAP